jgi:hypothetical protein
MVDIWSGFGLARVKREGTTQISWADDGFAEIKNETLKSLGLHTHRGTWVPKKIFNAFIAGLKHGE